MKKIYNIICSAICSLFVLAVAGCDLELREDPLGDVGELVEDSISEFGYTVDGVSNANSTWTFSKGLVSSDTGVAFSFNITTAVTSDWDYYLKTTHTKTNLATMQYYSDGSTVTTDIYESGVGLNGSNTWDTFLNTNCFVTISFDTDGSISFYKDGELAVGGSNAKNTFRDGTHTIAKQNAALISDLADGGSINTSILMKNFTVTKAVTADEAAELYTKYKVQ